MIWGHGTKKVGWQLQFVGVIYLAATLSIIGACLVVCEPADQDPPSIDPDELLNRWGYEEPITPLYIREREDAATAFWAPRSLDYAAVLDRMWPMEDPVVGLAWAPMVKADAQVLKAKHGGDARIWGCLLWLRCSELAHNWSRPALANECDARGCL